MSLKNFSVNIKKANTKKRFKITNSINLKKYWRWLKKNKWLNLSCPITEAQSGIIIKTINNYYKERLLQGREVILPHRMGRLSIKKYHIGVSIRNGKLIIPYKPDWQKTLKLWYEDEEARKNKTLIRFETDTRYKIIYSTHYAVYENKIFYKFTPVRSFKIELKNRCKESDFDVLPLK